MKYRNQATGELAPPHLIGHDEDGRNLYQAVEGWEPDEPYDVTAEGDWALQAGGATHPEIYPPVNT